MAKLVPMNLQYFADPDGGGEGGQGGEPTPPTPPAGGAQVDVDEVKANARADFLKDLGVDDEDSLKEILNAHNEQIKANQTELEGAKGELEKTNGKLTKESQRANDAEFKLAAFIKGTKEDSLDDLKVLAEAEIAGKKAKSVDEAIDHVLERNPQFKSEAGTKSAVADQNITGGNGTGAGEHAISADDLNQYRIAR